MAKTSVSIGTDTPTGEPVDAPRGPYVTDAHDDEVAAAARRPARPAPRREASRAEARAQQEVRPPRMKGPAQP